jgi:FkbM family methyltransferase
VKALDPDRSYLGFEPSPLCVYAIDALISENGLTDSVIAPVAVSDKDGVLSLHFNSSFDAAATTIEGFWTGANAKANVRRVLAQTGDNLLAAYGVGAIAALKIDVEGGELEALRGLIGTIKAKGPPIVMEVLPASCELPETAKYRLGRIEALSALLDSVDYVAYRLGDSLEPTQEFDAKVFDARRTNYLMLPRTQPVAPIEEAYRNFLVILGG